MWIGNRRGLYFVVHGSMPNRIGQRRDQVLEWKKNFNHQRALVEPPITEFVEFLHARGIAQMDIITVPPPSFHSLDAYPAQLLCERATSALGLDLVMLWPERYAKHGKHWTQNISKVYKPPAQDVRGKMVLILDDICTTGNTLAAAMSAVLAAGGYPAACAYA
jgi:hypothetical protein